MPITYNLISTETGLNTMSVKRAIDVFSVIGIAKLTRNGIIFLVSHEEYIDKALPYLETPIKESFFVTLDDFNKYVKSKYNLYSAGLTALQYAPYISDKRKINANEQIFAITKKEAVNIPDKIIMKRRYENSDIEIQTWNYSPNICGGNPELLSLYLSLKNIKDERVQGALEELLEGIKYDRRT